MSQGRARNALPPSVCVAGMHRSGTSAVARILHEAGWYFGPEPELIVATDDNPAGHFELRMIMDVNENILAAFGGSWHTPPPLPSGWLRHPRVRSLARQAARYLRRCMAARARWAWKEPRTCLTWPFWRDLLGPMKIVLCVRHPLDVAHSLQQRDGFAIARGLELWRYYNERLLDDTRATELLVTPFERVMASPLQECRRVLAFAEGQDVSDALSERAARAIQPPLWRQRESQRAAPSLPQPVADLYEALVRRSQAGCAMPAAGASA